MSTPTKYIVWKRNDGYVAASVNHMPSGWVQPNDNKPVTFEKLGEFTEWHEAYMFIQEYIKPQVDAAILAGLVHP
jgi:hypothetical protein